MKLLDIHRREVVDFLHPPPYAVLSHTWSASSPSPTEWILDRTRQQLLPYDKKLLGAILEARNRDVCYLWVESLCVDRASNRDVQLAVSCAANRLKRSTVCLAYLEDLSAGQGPPLDDDWSRCSYWKRAWTLPEVIVPPRVEFFDKNWNHCGSKSSPDILPLLSRITNIPARVLLDPSALADICLAARISWFADKLTSRDEDAAYAMLPLVGLGLYVEYGEGGKRAFLRLMEALVHRTRDGSIFAWRSNGSESVRGLLAHSPSEFRHFSTKSAIISKAAWKLDGKVSVGSKGIWVQSHFYKHGSAIMMEIGQKHPEDALARVGVCVRCWNGTYVRVDPASEARITEQGSPMEIRIAPNLGSRTTANATAGFASIDQSTSITSQTSVLPLRPAPQFDLGAHDHLDQTDPQVPPPYDLFQRKRKRSMAPVSPTPHGKFYFKCPWSISDDEDFDSWYDESENESDATSSTVSSGDEIDGDDGHEKMQLDDVTVGEYARKLMHGFPGLRREMLSYSYRHVQEWLASARYTRPPNDRLPPRKRARISGCESALVTPKEAIEEESDFVVLPHSNGYYHLACPYYLYDPSKNSKCLLHCSFRSVEGVIQHLKTKHEEPPWCAICAQVFSHPAERDAHTRKRACQWNDSLQAECLNAYKQAKLSSRDKIYLSEDKRWKRVWSTVFPGTKLPDSPYLEEGVAREVSMVRDFWARNGEAHVSRYLDAFCVLGDHETERDVLIAGSNYLMMVDLLNKVVKEHGKISST
ncbi:hypothetical protein S7711_05798 [Stachybotrys chartarum IBT 7711]|uniref:Heterokaryon incompatibility domain-containing protein n=1 Tax=Stachybotrys chartarum (strain CBS 109288 / IBT 7711) TaxID=1280523 RepID=A0A084AM35_STACB|nr:hypothetical protein S7711_05798 [Stachybotrys chartarum IBT 7711]